MTNQDSDEKYSKAKKERQQHVESIINSANKKKIIVAGPGTGKTYLFHQLLENKTNTLTLTFVNSLVEDLSLELCGLSEVRTLHSFAKNELALHMKGKVRICPKLSLVIQEDAKILLNKEIDFDPIFHNYEDNNEYIKYYKKRKDYYKHYGYSDVIFAIIKQFEKNKDKVPTFEQIVVDEFQDFNRLEVLLIEYLATKSPILLVGDDDQALYDFKNASAEHIRQRHSEENDAYTSFSLPYCSRCTRVLVQAVNDVINAALKNDLFKGRVNKKFLYFEDKNKNIVSEQNNKIIYSQQYERKIPWFIEQQLSNIAKEIRNKFSVLIISPTKNKVKTIVEALKNKGFKNLEFMDKKDSEKITLLEGLKILLEDKRSNLGWRIVAAYLLKKEEFKKLLIETEKEDAEDIVEIIDDNYKKEVKAILKVLRAIKEDRDVDEKDLTEVLKKIEYDPYEMARHYLKDDIRYDYQRLDVPGLKKISIMASTIQGSKGLAAEYVFVTHFDDQYFIKDKDKTKISDRDICNFIVSLTRAEKKVFLISSETKEPTFLKWIDNSRIETIS